MWPGEQVMAVLEDLEKQWRRGRVPTLQAAMELIFWTLMTKELNKVRTLQQEIGIKLKGLSEQNCL